MQNTCIHWDIINQITNFTHNKIHRERISCKLTKDGKVMLSGYLLITWVALVVVACDIILWGSCDAL